MAADSPPEPDPTVAVLRRALEQASKRTQALQLPDELPALLIEEGVWSPAEALDRIDRSSWGLRPAALAALAPRTDPQRDAVAAIAELTGALAQAAMAERPERGVIEALGRREIAHADGDVIDHGSCSPLELICSVTPAKAGVQGPQSILAALDAGLRRHDIWERG